LLPLFGVASGLYDFEAWKVEFGRAYASVDEERKAASAWAQNDAIISETNSKGLSYWLGHNEFSDISADEFSAHYLGLMPRPEDAPARPVFEAPATDPPSSIDWVAKGAVTPIKNQQRCGSCWAFSTTGSIEGAYFVASGNLVSLSEEELVQCSHNGNHGCQGGLMDYGFQWVEKNGLCLESADPYTSGGGVTGSCVGKSATCAPNVTVTGFTDVAKGDEKALLAAVAQQPVSIAIEADKSAFQMYKGGVLDNPACGTKLDHGVLLVGYGTDGGKDYWKVKNSWGATWGEKGYIRMVRNKNQCGIAQQPSFPTGAKPAKPRPPTPPPPPPAPPHYGDPKYGCQPDEKPVKKAGTAGTWCAPSCIPLFKPCPKDTPPGITATPLCSVNASASSTGKRECALSCLKIGHACGVNATCQGSGLSGICTYDD